MEYGVAVIGAGWAGFAAARKAKALGLKVALIEKEHIGGTCLNRGCIPTKTLIQSAKVYSLTKKSRVFGVETASPSVILAEVQARKDQLLQQLRQGMESMLRGIDIVQGEAEMTSGTTLQAGGKQITAGSVVIATGSRPMELAGLGFDGKKIISSDQILNLKALPRTLLIIGGGVIGCEFSSLFSVLGSQVTVAEKLPQLLPGIDKEVAQKLENIYKRKGIKVMTNTEASTLDLNAYELVLVCVGRTPDFSVPGLGVLGVTVEHKRISVDATLRTSIPNIYAAGDCTGQVLLAHFAAYQGGVAAWNIARPDNPQKADATVIPNCIFTDPEIASVGITEAHAAASGIEPVIHRFDFLGSGMARILDETEGFMKIVSDNRTGKLIGGVIIGPRATELISILTLAVSTGLKISQLKNTIFAHPTLSESIHDALS